MSRAAMTQALAALILAQKDAQIAEADYAITALRDALAEPQPTKPEAVAEFWNALGRWIGSLGVQAPLVELAPPQYLMDAWAALEPKLAEPQGEPSQTLGTSGSLTRFGNTEPRGEPVAWIESPYGSIKANPLYHFTAPKSLEWRVPLYPHPQDTALLREARDALRERHEAELAFNEADAEKDFGGVTHREWEVALNRYNAAFLRCKATLARLDAALKENKE